MRSTLKPAMRTTPIRGRKGFQGQAVQPARRGLTYSLPGERSAPRRFRRVCSEWVTRVGEDTEDKEMEKRVLPLPIQVTEPARPMTPERQLMWAVLERAMRDLRVVQTAAALGAHSCRRRRDNASLANVEAWFETREEHWPFSFWNICSVLGLPPEAVRRALGDSEDAKAGQQTRLRRRKPRWRVMSGGGRSAGG